LLHATTVLLAYAEGTSTALPETKPRPDAGTYPLMVPIDAQKSSAARKDVQPLVVSDS
jgi:hypothetical protein